MEDSGTCKHVLGVGFVIQLLQLVLLDMAL